jgi:DNA-binding XRE family transcriptional regulator
MDDTVTLTRQEYQDLIDARDHVLAVREVAAGRMETISSDELPAYLAAATPLAFWRRKRGLTQAALAEQVGITQPYLAQIETGKRTGEVGLYVKLARALRLRVEDLVAE